jgi:LPXTG-motif cell wall-anchored protein
MAPMAKKTGMSDSSLWIFTVALLALSAWMYFKK